MASHDTEVAGNSSDVSMYLHWGRQGRSWLNRGSRRSRRIRWRLGLSPLVCVPGLFDRLRLHTRKFRPSCCCELLVFGHVLGKVCRKLLDEVTVTNQPVRSQNAMIERPITRTSSHQANAQDGIRSTSTPHEDPPRQALVEKV